MSSPDAGRLRVPWAGTTPVNGLAWELPAKPGGDLVLMPGQMHVGAQVASLRTLLGSCVAITLWHPQRRIGGMCHYLLPKRARRAGDPLDGRYGDEALYAMAHRMREHGTDPAEYHAHLHGGADTFAGDGAAPGGIGSRNIEQGWQLVRHYGFRLEGADVGGNVPRFVTLNLSSGEVDVRRGEGRTAAVAAVPTRW